MGCLICHQHGEIKHLQYWKQLLPSIQKEKKIQIQNHWHSTNSKKAQMIPLVLPTTLDNTINSLPHDRFLKTGPNSKHLQTKK